MTMSVPAAEHVVDGDPVDEIGRVGLDAAPSWLSERLADDAHPHAVRAFTAARETFIASRRIDMGAPGRVARSRPHVAVPLGRQSRRPAVGGALVARRSHARAGRARGVRPDRRRTGRGGAHALRRRPHQRRLLPAVPAPRARTRPAAAHDEGEPDPAPLRGDRRVARAPRARRCAARGRDRSARPRVPARAGVGVVHLRRPDRRRAPRAPIAPAWPSVCCCARTDRHPEQTDAVPGPLPLRHAVERQRPVRARQQHRLLRGDGHGRQRLDDPPRRTRPAWRRDRRMRVARRASIATRPSFPDALEVGISRGATGHVRASPGASASCERARRSR